VDDTQLFPLKIKKNEKLHCIRARNTLLHKTESLKIRCDALKADGGGCEALFFIVICGLFAAANFNAQRSSSKPAASCTNFSRYSPKTTRTLRTMTTSATNGDVNDEDVLTQYIILRRDLWREKAWPLGSIAAQVAHASVAALETFKTNEDSIKYVAKEKLSSMTKVVLEVKGEAQLMTLSEKLTENNIDYYAWREQPEDYVTCVALRPYRKEEVRELLKKCNLASDVRGG